MYWVDNVITGKMASFKPKQNTLISPQKLPGMWFNRFNTHLIPLTKSFSLNKLLPFL